MPKKDHRSPPSAEAPRRGRVWLQATSPCVESLLDLERARAWLMANGWEPVAELALLWTCGVDQPQQDRSLARIQAIRASAPVGQRVVVTGCLAAIDPAAVARGHDGPSVPPRQLDRLDALIEAEQPLASFEAESLDPSFAEGFPLASSRFYRGVLHGSESVDRRLGTRLRERWMRAVAWQPTRDMVFLRIASGCQGRCGFCAVKRARGALSSVPPERIWARHRGLLAQGHRRFTLVATDAGAYGLDLGTDLAALLEGLLEQPGDWELAIDYLSPDHLLRMRDRLLALAGDPRLRFVCVPVQSGSPAVLAAMRRDYDPDALAETLRELQRRAPWLIIKGIFLLGHPGEGRAELRETMDFVARVPFSNLTALVYTPRAGTPSAALPDSVDPAEKRWRRWRLFSHYLLTRGRRRLSP